MLYVVNYTYSIDNILWNIPNDTWISSSGAPQSPKHAGEVMIKPSSKKHESQSGSIPTFHHLGVS